jgi:hypothetical protein
MTQRGFGGMKENQPKRGRPPKPPTTLINFRIPVSDYTELKKIPKLTDRFKEWIKSII